MKTRDLRLEIKEWGSILDWMVKLENVTVGHWSKNESTNIYYKDLKSYTIDGLLDVKFLCKGKKGSSALLTVKIQGQADETLECILVSGSKSQSKSITIV